MARRRGLAFVVSLCAGLLLGCDSSANLDLLSKDPMATATFSHTHRLQEYTKKDGAALGKPRYAEVLRTFTVDSDADAKAVLSEAVLAAEEAGWSKASWSRDPSGLSWSGTKESSRGPMSIDIVIDPSRDRFLVSLDATEMRGND